MKEQAIQKINKIGKVSNIVVLVAKIILIVGMVSCMLGAIICFLPPADIIQMDMKGNMNMKMDYSAMGLTDEEFSLDMNEIDDEELEIQRTSVSIGGFDGSLSVSMAEQEYQPVSVTCENGKMSMELETEVKTLNLRHVGVFCLMALLALALTLVTLFFVGALCIAFRDCTSPFEENVIKKMQNLAIALVPWSLASSIVTSTLQSFMQGIVSISISLDLGVILVVLIVLVLVYIFKYGAVLQQESDETL